ncbi:MAG: DegT/DnrJ/EryC1/StrS family aminotransferase, partial [Candidatus Altiarchaeota archaeon]|nr:DegT/DnrJ/EryC1/StrS family aminotransferase [Candidatus Altiarchaeota archaeon]
MKMIPIAKPSIGECEKKAVNDVLESGMIACGSVVSEFEKGFASYCDTSWGVATTSGTSALCVALKALGISEKDHVLTTPFSFMATANSILYCNAKPVFADICDDTFNISPEKIREKLDEDDRINTLLLVHLYGLSCDMDEIMKIVKQYQIQLVEDCAQAHGAQYNGKKVGSFGDAACFSFYPTKNMTTGEGGMIVSSSEEVIENSRRFINHGMRERYLHEELGFNYRMTNIQAALGLCQLEKLDSFTDLRMSNAAFLSKNLDKSDWLTTPHVPSGCKHVFHQYTVKVDDRDS